MTTKKLLYWFPITACGGGGGVRMFVTGPGICWTRTNFVPFKPFARAFGYSWYWLKRVDL